MGSRHIYMNCRSIKTQLSFKDLQLPFSKFKIQFFTHASRRMKLALDQVSLLIGAGAMAAYGTSNSQTETLSFSIVAFSVRLITWSHI